MRIAIGSDEKTKTTEDVVDYLKSQGRDVALFGALVKPLPAGRQVKANWVDVAKEVALTVKNRKADEGILFCWTGTGVAMAASKIPGIRAATVSDLKTAKNARAWNHANILALSCFMPAKKAVKIVGTWLKTPYSTDPDDLESIKKLERLGQELSR